MKVLLLNGSPKANGNTAQALEILGAELTAQNIEIEMIHVGNKQLRGCMACNMCRKNGDQKCIIKDGDFVNETIQKMKEADGIVISSPVYYAAIAGTMKCFLDRAFYAGASFVRGKVGASVVAVRRSGGISTFNQLNNFLNYGEMIMPTSNYWNVAHGTAPGEIHKDPEGVQIMRVQGKNMARTLKLLEFGKKEVPMYEAEEKEWTNFIR